MSKTNYLEDKILDHVLRNTAYTSPTTVYMALFTAAPGEAGGGTEISGGGYARQAITFGAASAGAISNSADVTFPVSTSNHGSITHFAILDASTGGNMLYFGALGTAKNYDIDDQIKFTAGDIDITDD